MNDKKKILIVEDDVFIHDIYKVKFSQEGFDVSVAENGMEALKELEKNIPDMILLDIIMPRMDGTDLLKKIKKNEKWSKIPVIVLSNISEKREIKRRFKEGVSDYLVKSNFTPSEVVEKVNVLLNERKMV
jgi:DNA-binding response OmpR family regulator